MPHRTVLAALMMALFAALACSSPAAQPAVQAPAGQSNAGQPGGQAPANSPPQTISKVTYGEVGSASDAGVYIADAKGYFRDQGIELDKVRFQSAAEMVAPLGIGQLDVGGGAPSAGLMNAVAREVSVKIVADKGNLTPGFGFQAMMIRKELVDSGAVKGPGDLKGRPFANSGQGITPEVAIDAYLKSGGLSFSDVNIVLMGFPDMVQAFANGSIDAAQIIEPFATQASEAGSAVIVKRNDELVPRQQVAVIMYSPKFAAEQTDVARRFMLAYVKGLRDYNDAFVKKNAAKRDEIIDILINATTVKSRPLYDKIVMPGLDPNGKVNTPSLEESQTFWLARGIQQQKVDLTTVIDNQFTDWAVQQLGPYN